MEPTSGQFSNVYRKGGDDSGLRKRAVEQSIGEMDRTRKMTSAERYADDVQTGVQGARNAVTLNPTLKEATENPDMLGGPVSGAALSKFKDKKVQSKKTAEREMKRR